MAATGSATHTFSSVEISGTENQRHFFDLVTKSGRSVVTDFGQEDSSQYEHADGCNGHCSRGKLAHHLEGARDRELAHHPVTASDHHDERQELSSCMARSDENGTAGTLPDKACERACVGKAGAVRDRPRARRRRKAAEGTR
jgi:hypothetical protein